MLACSNPYCTRWKGAQGRRFFPCLFHQPATCNTGIASSRILQRSRGPRDPDSGCKFARILQHMRCKFGREDSAKGKLGSLPAPGGGMSRKKNGVDAGRKKWFCHTVFGTQRYACPTLGTQGVFTRGPTTQPGENCLAPSATRRPIC